ncbi:MAG: helix-turn-helix transcriptional regulator [Yersinia sp. (in: enterobacteria)]
MERNISNNRIPPMDFLKITPRISLRCAQTTLEQDVELKGEHGPHLSLVMMLEGAGHFMLNQQGPQYYRPQSFWVSFSQENCICFDFFPRHHFYHLLIIEYSADLAAQVAACGLSPADQRAWVRSSVLTAELNKQMQWLQRGMNDRSPLGLLHLESMALEALWMALRELRQQRAQKNLPVARTCHFDRRRLITARSYIGQNAAQPLSAEDVANHAGLSQVALKRGFRAMFGITLWSYVIECRLLEAQRLLESSPLSLNDIALRCGFAHASHMTRFFQRKYGQTPGRYRAISENSISAG